MQMSGSAAHVLAIRDGRADPVQDFDDREGSLVQAGLCRIFLALVLFMGRCYRLWPLPGMVAGLAP
jgi:hypothetical protein